MIIEYKILQDFENLIEKFKLNKGKLVDGGETFFVDFHSRNFSFTLEMYRRTLSISLYKKSEPEKRISLYNLLNYLNATSDQNLQAKYYENEKNLKNSFQMQTADLSNVITENFNKIDRFFCDQDYDFHFAKLEADMIKKYPHLFRT